MTQNFNNKKLLIDITLIFILGLTPLLWFGFSHGLIDGGDTSFPLIPINEVYRFSHTWDDRIFMGQDNSQTIPSLFPYRMTIALLDITRLPLTIIQRIWFMLVFTFSGLSMYYLVSKIIKGRDRRIVGLPASIFYMINLYVLERFLMGHHILLLVYGTIPIILALFIDYLENDKKSKKVFVLIALSSLLCAPVGSNPPMYLNIVFVIGLYIIFYILVHKNIKQVLKLISNVALLAILLNIWWVVPYFSYFSCSYSYLTEFPIPSNQQVITASSYSSLPELFRLLGEWIWYVSHRGDAYSPFAQYYSSNFMLIIITFLIPILAFSALVFQKNKYTIFFAILALFGLFFSMGVHPPFGNLYNWMFLNIPGFFIFREPYAKFMSITCLGYSVLIGLSTLGLLKLMYKKIKRRREITILSLVILVIIISSWPIFLMGIDDFYSQRNLLPKKIVTNIPNYYFESANWINFDKSDCKVFLLPQQYYFNTFWNYSGQDITERIITKPTIYQSPAWGPYFSVNIYNNIYEIIHQNSTKNIRKILNLINIKYILQRNDVRYDIYDNIDNPLHIYSVLSSQRNIHLGKSFGNLDLYKIDDEYFLPHIYPATTSTLINGGINEMFQFVTSDDFIVGNSALFLSNDLDQEQIQFIKEHDNTVLSTDGNAPKITFQKINPTRYKIKVNASQPFFLVFSESYHPQWKAYAGDKEIEFDEIIASYENVNVKEARHEMKFTPGDISYLFAKPLPDDNHFLVSGYANAWYIDPKEIDKDGDGSFVVTLYFWPQSLFFLGLFISGMTFIGCVGYLFYDWRKGRGDEWVKKIERRLRRF